MKEKDKKIVTLIVALGLIITIIGGTFAYFRWQTSTEQETSVTFTVTSSFSCSADGGDISTNNISLAPTDCTNSQYAIKRKITTNSIITAQDKTVYMDLWLDIETIDPELANTENFKWVFTKEENSCDTDNAVSYGTFEDLTDQDTIMLLDSKSYETTTRDDTYYLYIWLDKAETSPDTQDKNFEFKLNGECTDIASVSGPEVPILDKGLIPVILSDDSTNGYKVTATTVDDPNWYNYENKQWANSVLVKDDGEKTRAQNSVPTTEIDTDDILAYFVWIPRYAYQIWTLAESSTGSEQQIAIEWESADASYQAGTQVGEYRTHPAFWRDNNSDNVVDSGETIAGIWVGKFETTGDETTPTILPNAKSNGNGTVSSQFQTGLKFAGGTLSNGAVNFSTTNSYGMELTLTSHMMKNSEWGAVAYLSHSKYGLCQGKNCKEIRINNCWNSGYITGCGALEENAGESSTCSNAYASGISEYPQSTTGNITGIFDMSGGGGEHVMGIFANSDGNLFSGHYIYNSGFNGLIYKDNNYIEYTEGISFPTETKYYDKYQATNGITISSLTACNGGICYGHALSETNSWYDDRNYFISRDFPILYRGGNFSNSKSSGLFAFHLYPGNSYGEVPYGFVSFRSVLSQ